MNMKNSMKDTGQFAAAKDLKSLQCSSARSLKVSRKNSSMTSLCSRAQSVTAVKVAVGNCVQEVMLPDGHVNCGWLLSQVQEIFERSKSSSRDGRKVVAISTEGGNETLNYYLTLPDR